MRTIPRIEAAPEAAAQPSAPAHPIVERRCPRCGYGIATARIPEACPMCAGTEWRPVRRVA